MYRNRFLWQRTTVTSSVHKHTESLNDNCACEQGWSGEGGLAATKENATKGAISIKVPQTLYMPT